MGFNMKLDKLLSLLAVQIVLSLAVTTVKSEHLGLRMLGFMTGVACGILTMWLIIWLTDNW